VLQIHKIKVNPIQIVFIADSLTAHVNTQASMLLQGQREITKALMQLDQDSLRSATISSNATLISTRFNKAAEDVDIGMEGLRDDLNRIADAFKRQKADKLGNFPLLKAFIDCERPNGGSF
jgi:hypothetical protein